MRHLFLLVIVLASATSARPQNETQPSFPAGTEIVTVDAVVLDRQGTPLRGLRREDFTVTEDGAPQEITAFEAVDRSQEEVAKSAATATTGSRATSSNVDAAARGDRSFILVFDELHLDLGEAKRGREAVAELLKSGVVDGDRVTLIGTAGATWWTARVPEGRGALLQVAARLQGRRIQEFQKDEVSDYEAMRIYRDSDPVVTDRVARRLVEQGTIASVTPLPGESADNDLDSQRDQARARAAQVYERSAAQNEATLSLVERSIASLESVRGRKSLVLVSGGIVADPHLSGFRRVVTEARRANVAIYFLDARGLSAATANLQADNQARVNFNDLGATLTEGHERSDGTVSLAADTGGFSIENQNDLGGGIGRIARESASYYLLGYTPTDKRADGRFHKIQVKVAGAGRTVRARRGYYAPGQPKGAPKPPEPRDAAIQRAIDSPFDLPEVPLRATAHVFGEGEPGKIRVVLTAEADIAHFAFDDTGGTSRDMLETMLVVADRATGEFFRFDQQFDMKFRPETRARYDKTWFPIHREISLVPGSYQARIVARDKNGSRVGSLTHDFEVPGLAGLRLSTPILSDSLREDAGNGGRSPELIARRTFAPAGLLHCRFEVFGAAKDAQTGAPRVTAGFSIRRSDGKFLAAAPETPLKPAPDGALARTQGTPLEGAPAGSYELIVVVTDLVAGQVAETRAPFEIRPAAP